MYRFARLSIVAFVFCLTSSAPAFAQANAPDDGQSLFAAAATGALAEQLPPPTLPAVRPAGARRPSALMPLYVSFGTLQVLDGHSTVRALRRGAVEANPLMRGIVGNPAGLFAVKTAGTAGVIYAGEKLWKRNKAAAVIFMVATNSAMAWVVQHNYRIVR